MVDKENRPAAVPILVGGEHRSGTTLLAAILDSHPQVVFGLELPFEKPTDLGPHVLECCALARASSVPLADVRWGERLWAGGQFVLRCDNFGVGPDVLESLVRRVMRERRSDLVEFPDRCALVDAIGEWRRREVGVPSWGFKIQRAITKARVFSSVWPQARFIHIVRDGRDVAASHVRDHSRWGYRDVGAAAAGWGGLVEATRPLRGWRLFHEIRYEDLIRRPRRTLAALLRFLDLPWDEAVLSHSRAPHSFLKADGHGHPTVPAVRNPIGDGALGRHRRDLTGEEIRTVEGIAGPWLAALGYVPGPHPAPAEV